MANALQFDAPPDARMMPVPGSPTNPAPAPVRQNALSPVPMMAQPKPKQPNMLADAFKSFARGFAPEQVQASDDRTKAEAGERAKKALVWMQQTAAQPLERRAQFTQQYAQQIAADTGQPLEAIMQSVADPSGFSDEAISQGIAAISAQLGQGPTAPDYQFLQGPEGQISVGDKGTGRVQQVQPGTPKPRAPIIIGNNAYDPDTYEPVIQGEAKPNLPDGWQMGENGPEPIPGYAEWYRKIHPGDGQGSGGSPPSGYRWKPDGTLERIPGGPADKPAGPEYTQKQVTDYTNTAKTLDALEGAVNQYQSLIDTYGPQLWDRNLNPLDNPGVRTVAAAKLDAARTAVDIQIKELFNLGVLNGPDLDIIRGAIPDLTGGEALGSSKENAKASLGVVYDYIKRGRNQVPEQFIQKARPNGAPQGTAERQYSPDQVAQAKAALANWDRIPAAFKTPQMRAMAEKIAGVSDQGQPEDGIDPQISSQIDGLFPEDNADVPDGVDPQEWQYMTPEERALFQ